MLSHAINQHYQTLRSLAKTNAQFFHQVRFLKILPVVVGAATAFLFTVAPAAFFAAAVVAVLFTGALGLEATVLIVEPLMTTLLLVFEAAVVAVIFLVGALVTVVVFFVVNPLAGFVTTVAVVEAALCSDVFERIEA